MCIPLLFRGVHAQSIALADNRQESAGMLRVTDLGCMRCRHAWVPARKQGGANAYRSRAGRSQPIEVARRWPVRTCRCLTVLSGRFQKTRTAAIRANDRPVTGDLDDPSTHCVVDAHADRMTGSNPTAAIRSTRMRHSCAYGRGDITAASDADPCLRLSDCSVFDVDSAAATTFLPLRVSLVCSPLRHVCMTIPPQVLPRCHCRVDPHARPVNRHPQQPP